MTNKSKDASAAVMAKSPTPPPTQTSEVSEGRPSAVVSDPTRTPEHRTNYALDLTPQRFPHARKR